MRKDVMMISAGLMMMAMASCNQTEYREITEDRVVSQPVDTIKVADHFYLAAISRAHPRTSEADS